MLLQVLLHNPHNHLYHQRQAEIRYTWGGFEQLDLVRRHCGSVIVNVTECVTEYVTVTDCD